MARVGLGYLECGSVTCLNKLASSERVTNRSYHSLLGKRNLLFYFLSISNISLKIPYVNEVLCQCSSYLFHMVIASVHLFTFRWESAILQKVLLIWLRRLEWKKGADDACVARKTHSRKVSCKIGWKKEANARTNAWLFKVTDESIAISLSCIRSALRLFFDFHSYQWAKNMYMDYAVAIQRYLSLFTLFTVRSSTPLSWITLLLPVICVWRSDIIILVSVCAFFLSQFRLVVDCVLAALYSTSCVVLMGSFFHYIFHFSILHSSSARTHTHRSMH